MTTPNPEIVAAIYNLDPSALIHGGPIRRFDGTIASPEEADALRSTRLCDIRAASEMHELALEQAKHCLEKKERILQLLQKYSLDDEDEIQLGVIEQRMTLADWVEYSTLWNSLGNFIELEQP